MRHCPTDETTDEYHAHHESGEHEAKCHSNVLAPAAILSELATLDHMLKDTALRADNLAARLPGGRRGFIPPSPSYMAAYAILCDMGPDIERLRRLLDDATEVYDKGEEVGK